ncbi:SDR family NAD(P)-dependent oxidoreductase [Cryobacterium sp. CG_9.6]|uniref:SDR family NAD(P)-dependent oxidoreductase n=1 Tax=Cryobacterium sp. CG_9.6 TaxID=2760710 RepID=UPI0024767A9A|nr:SDR family NAD(P)-dependent oxidoreductase [Cryobacterium sp. CG_9.6]MDH6236727.1 NAD(P)-dependent dehydrogenase (short-subunit alcohol dehydrogenase family) [Cryobacterium sp. CG_9.6]
MSNTDRPNPSTQRPVALVTGAARGLGAAIAKALGVAGWVVAGLDLTPCATTLSIQVDVTDAAAVADAVQLVERDLGPIAALVTVAGIYEELLIDDITDSAWDRMLAVNIGGTINACSAVVPVMLKRGAGAIVTISSDLGVGGSQGDAHYAATKGAIVGFSRSLARELLTDGIFVNSVAPGAADTAMLSAESPWRADSFLKTLPIPRLVRPDEIAGAVLFLLEAGNTMTGQLVSPNSGATI